MPNNEKLKCAECTRRGRPCMDMSWDTVERTKERLKAEVALEEERRDRLFEELAELQARLARKRRVLEQAQRRSDEQTECLIREMEESGENLTRTVLDVSFLEAQLDVPFEGTSLAVLGTK